MSDLEPYFLDDRVIIPEEVKRMTQEQLRQEIARLEEEIRRDKAKNQKLIKTA